MSENTTGYQIRERIRLLTQKLTVERRLWDRAKTFFKSEGEIPPDLEAIASNIYNLETELVHWQEAQTKFNLAVYIEGTAYGRISLTFAIKLLGRATRMQRMWEALLSDVSKPSWMSDDSKTRDKTKEVAVSSVSDEKAAALAAEYATEVSDLRAIIARGNANEMVIDEY